MLPYLLLATLIGGLFMFLLCTKNLKAEQVGGLLFFASLLALLIALAPATVAKLHG